LYTKFIKSGERRMGDFRESRMGARKQGGGAGEEGERGRGSEARRRRARRGRKERRREGTFGLFDLPDPDVLLRFNSF
jgi:hypothetical protein